MNMGGSFYKGDKDVYLKTRRSKTLNEIIKILSKDEDRQWGKVRKNYRNRIRRTGRSNAKGG